MKSTNDKIEKRTRFGLWKIVSDMLDKPNEYGIYPTTECYDKLDERATKLIKETLQECIDPMLVDIFPDENNPLQNHNKRLRKHYSQEALTKLEELLK